MGFPFLIVSNGGGHLIRADGSPRYAMLCNLLGAIINTILDPIFIFVFNMDMAGAALATVIGQLFSFLMAVRYFRNFKTVSLRRHHFAPVWSYIRRIVSLGTSPAFNQVSMMVVQIIMNKSLTHYGALSVYGESIPLAVAGIINKVAMIFFSLIIGISQGMQPIASFNYGAKKYDRVKGVYKIAIRSGLVVSTTAFLSFQIFPRQIISIFGSGSKEYFDFATSYFRIYMLFTFLNCVQPVSSNLFTSIGKPRGYLPVPDQADHLPATFDSPSTTLGGLMVSCTYTLPIWQRRLYRELWPWWFRIRKNPPQCKLINWRKSLFYGTF